MKTNVGDLNITNFPAEKNDSYVSNCNVFLLQIVLAYLSNELKEENRGEKWRDVLEKVL